MNLARRQLTPSQRAAAAAELANMKGGNPTGANQYKSGTRPIGPVARCNLTNQIACFAKQPRRWSDGSAANFQRKDKLVDSRIAAGLGPLRWAHLREGRVFAPIGKNYWLFRKQTLDAKGIGVRFKQGPAKASTFLDDLADGEPAEAGRGYPVAIFPFCGLI